MSITLQAKDFCFPLPNPLDIQTANIQNVNLNLTSQNIASIDNNSDTPKLLSCSAPTTPVRSLHRKHAHRRSEAISSDFKIKDGLLLFPSSNHDHKPSVTIAQDLGHDETVGQTVSHDTLKVAHSQESMFVQHSSVGLEEPIAKTAKQVTSLPTSPAAPNSFAQFSPGKIFSKHSHSHSHSQSQSQSQSHIHNTNPLSPALTFSSSRSSLPFEGSSTSLPDTVSATSVSSTAGAHSPLVQIVTPPDSRNPAVRLDFNNNNLTPKQTVKIVAPSDHYHLPDSPVKSFSKHRSHKSMSQLAKQEPVKVNTPNKKKSHKKVKSWAGSLIKFRRKEKPVQLDAEQLNDLDSSTASSNTTSRGSSIDGRHAPVTNTVRHIRSNSSIGFSTGYTFGGASGAQSHSQSRSEIARNLVAPEPIIDLDAALGTLGTSSSFRHTLSKTFHRRTESAPEAAALDDRNSFIRGGSRGMKRKMMGPVVDADETIIEEEEEEVQEEKQTADGELSGTEPTGPIPSAKLFSSECSSEVSLPSTVSSCSSRERRMRYGYGVNGLPVVSAVVPVAAATSPSLDEDRLFFGFRNFDQLDRIHKLDGASAESYSNGLNQSTPDNESYNSNSFNLGEPGPEIRTDDITVTLSKPPSIDQSPRPSSSFSSMPSRKRLSSITHDNPELGSGDSDKPNMAVRLFDWLRNKPHRA